jgi:hypothetical protein
VKSLVVPLVVASGVANVHTPDETHDNVPDPFVDSTCPLDPSAEGRVYVVLVLVFGAAMVSVPVPLALPVREILLMFVRL